MPFIDDDLLWCPDNFGDGKMVDLSQCLENTGGLGELSHSDLTGLVSGLDDEEEEDIFKQLDASSFEIDFFDFNEEKEENNNSLVVGPTVKNPAAVALLQEIQRSSAKVSKLNIAAANPLLAEKLATPASVVPGSPTATCDSSVFPPPLRQIKTEPDTRPVDTAPPPAAVPLFIKRERDASSDHKTLLHGILSQHHAALLNYNHSNTGSLPPSPADSGVSDVDSSSSGHTSNDELRARLQPNHAATQQGQPTSSIFVFQFARWTRYCCRVAKGQTGTYLVVYVTLNLMYREIYNHENQFKSIPII
uniref:Uncharacterized protein n=1 Tax=Clastoptera arizonana TaxID=38151 RepID=A0A1B6D0X6_9HEMI